MSEEKTVDFHRSSSRLFLSCVSATFSAHYNAHFESENRRHFGGSVGDIDGERNESSTRSEIHRKWQQKQTAMHLTLFSNFIL